MMVNATPVTTPDQPAPSGNRLASVEVMRVVAIGAVLCIHALPFAHGTGRPVVGTAWDTATVINQLARFAVPCFFVLSGVFWARRTAVPANRWSVTRSMVSRLLLLFVGWSLVFVLPWEGDRVFPDFPVRWWANLEANVRWIGRHPWQVLFSGTNGHLWFLMSLAQATVIGALLTGRVRDRWLLALGGALFAVYLLAKPYRQTPWGIALGFNPRNGPFLSWLFFSIGVWVARREPAPQWLRRGAVLVAGGILLSALELTWLHAHARASLSQDAVIGTIPFGVGVAMLALSGHPWLSWPRVARLGSAVLGVYASHPIFIELLGPLANRFRSGWWDLLAVGLVFILSLALARLLARGRGTRWLVR